MVMKKVLFIFMTAIFFVGCSGTENEEVGKIISLNKIDDISLDYNAYSQTIIVSRNIENCKYYIKGNSFWLSNVEIKDNKISFDVLENIYYQKGYRSDSIIITEKDNKIGSIAVFQARNPYSPTKLAWCTDNATYKNKGIDGNLTGKQVTEFICNISKTTSGKDSYKNYPAIAYCIEMNHDLNNIEWYLPSPSEMMKILANKGFEFFKFNNFWSSENFNYRAIYCRFSDNKQQQTNMNDSKTIEQCVFACRK